MLCGAKPVELRTTRPAFPHHEKVFFARAICQLSFKNKLQPTQKDFILTD
jgi:hypothetical protein